MVRTSCNLLAADLWHETDSSRLREHKLVYDSGEHQVEMTMRWDRSQMILRRFQLSSRESQL